MTWLAKLHCRLREHRWQSVQGETMQVCLRCGANGWLMP